MRRVCGGCFGDLGELSTPCPDCGSLGAMNVMRAGEVASFSPEMGVACGECGETRREVRFTHFRRVVGLLWFDQIYTHGGYFCSSCRRRLFFKYEALTLVLGWWGFLAMFVRNPYAIFSNVMALVRPPILPGARNVVTVQDLYEAAVGRSGHDTLPGVGQPDSIPS